MHVDMEKDSIKKLLFNYSAPAISGMLISALYMLVDGIFVGQGVGPEGLAAINIAYPVIMLGVSLSMMLGMGGSTIISVLNGQGASKNETGKYLTHIIFFVVAFYLVIVSATFHFQERLIYFLGSNDGLYDMVRDYLLTGTAFLIFFMLSTALNAVVRNDKSPRYALIAMAIGTAVNITLDWLFIIEYGMGMRGAALATGIAQTASFLFLASYFFRETCGIRPVFIRISTQYIRRIIKNGFPSFVMEFAFALVLILFNNILIIYLGELGASAFGAISYIFYVFIMIFTGLAQGIQPIVSYNFGARKHDRLKETLVLAHKVSFSIASFILLSVYFKGDAMISIFNSEPEFVAVAANGLLIYTSAIMLMGANFVTISYLQSMEQSRIANILSISRSTVFVMLGLVILPKVLGVNGIWLALPFSDLMTFCVSIVINRIRRPSLENTQQSFEQAATEHNGSISC